MSWRDFLDEIFNDETKPGKVMICFVNRYLEGLDGVQYKIKYDGREKSGTTAEHSFCIEVTPSSFNPIQTYVWSRKVLAFKKLDNVVPEAGRKKLVRKVLNTFKTTGNPDQLPKKTPNNPAPEKPAPAPAPGPSPKTNQGNLPQTTKNENNQPLAKPERPVPAVITVEQLRKIFPKNRGEPSDAHLQEVADELNSNLAKYKLDTPYRRAHFFGQIKRESPSLSGAAESLNYTSEGLIGTFGYYKKHKNEAREDGRLEKKLPNGKKQILRDANQEVIANKVYIGPDGNVSLGNRILGDGWRYRGRGMKQTTGRDNYESFTKKYPALWGEKVDFMAQPDFLSKMPYALRSAIFFWVDNECYTQADNGITDATIDAVTKIVNSGEITMNQQGAYKDPKANPVLLRRQYVKLAYAALT